MLVLAYTIYRNVWPYPAGAGRWFPILAGVWILLAVSWVSARPAAARATGRRLIEGEGFRPAEHENVPASEMTPLGATVADD